MQCEVVCLSPAGLGANCTETSHFETLNPPPSINIFCLFKMPVGKILLLSS